MTDRTHPDSGRIITSSDVIADLQARIAELEAELEAIGAGGVSGHLMNTLMRLVDEYAEVRLVNGCWVYSSKTASARQAVIEAFSGVQALSAAPAGWKLVPVEPTKEMVAAACREHGYPGGSRAAYVLGYKSMLAASPTPPAEQAAPKAAPGELFDSEGFRAWWADQLTTWTQRFVNAAPQQEAQAPVALLVRKNSWRAGQWEVAPPGSPSYGLGWADQRKYVYAAPQPAPAPLIARSLAEWHEEDGYVAWWAWNGREWAGEPAWIGTPNCEDWPGYHTHWTPHPEQPVCAALAAQGGK